MAGTRSTKKRLALLTATAALAIGCGSKNGTVTRIADGHVTEGRFIEPQAYASYLRGAIAEAHRDYRVALREYEIAAKIDDADPEIWTRIAAVRCTIDPHDLQARVALRQALIRDEDYAPAWEVRASCETARDVDRVDVERAAARAAEIDPRSAHAQTLAASVEEKRDVDAARKRLMALTLLAGGDAEAWSALGAWGGAHGDDELQSAAFSRVAALAPSKWNRVAEVVVALAGDGALREARGLAGSLADSERRMTRVNARSNFSIDHAPLVARLAVDDALVKGDPDLARSRASAGRLPLEEVSARALFLGRPTIAHDLAEEVANSDPKNFGASAALAAADPAHALPTPPDTQTRLSAAIYFAVALSHPRLAVTIEPIFEGDSLVNDIAAKLAASGRVESKMLSAEAEIEAAVRSGKLPHISKDADARHRFISCAFQPAGARAGCDSLQRHFSAITSRDLFVNVALAHLAIERGANASELRSFESELRLLGPSDPLASTTERELAARAKP